MYVAYSGAVRSAPADELIVTDGFSCREMIRHTAVECTPAIPSGVVAAVLAAGIALWWAWRRRR